jgi:hypothetical protein
MLSSRLSRLIAGDKQAGRLRQDGRGIAHRRCCRSIVRSTAALHRIGSRYAIGLRDE